MRWLLELPMILMEKYVYFIQRMYRRFGVLATPLIVIAIFVIAFTIPFAALHDFFYDRSQE